MRSGIGFAYIALVSAEFIAVEIRFSNTNTQKAYRYLRGGDPNYGFQDFVEVPFTVWDIDSDPPRQLNAAFVENSGSTSEDGTWLPADTEEDRPLGGREYLFILKSDYSDQSLAEYSEGKSILGDAETFDVLYAGWLKLADGQNWRFKAEGAALTVEESAYFADSSGPRRAMQIVLRGVTFGESEVSWVVGRAD